MLDLTAEVTRALEIAAPQFVELLRPVIREEVIAALDRHSDPLLPIPQAAEYCGLSAAAFRQRLQTDTHLQGLRQGTGRMSRFRRSDLNAWVQKVKPGRRKAVSKD